MAEPTEIFQGDSPTFRFELTATPTEGTTDNDPLDLTDYEIDFYLKRSLQDADSAAEFHASLDNAYIRLEFAAQDGSILVTIPGNITAALRLGRPYFWYLTMLPPEGEVEIPSPEQGHIIARRGAFLCVSPYVLESKSVGPITL